MAIGDNWNDLAMLEVAGRPVVMGSGAPDLVELAARRGWEIAPGNDEDGLAEVVEALLPAPFGASMGDGPDSAAKSAFSATSVPEGANVGAGKPV
jgi:hypothetical protein